MRRSMRMVMIIATAMLATWLLPSAASAATYADAKPNYKGMGTISNANCTSSSTYCVKAGGVFYVWAWRYSTSKWVTLNDGRPVYVYQIADSPWTWVYSASNGWLQVKAKFVRVSNPPAWGSW